MKIVFNFPSTSCLNIIYRKTACAFVRKINVSVCFVCLSVSSDIKMCIKFYIKETRIPEIIITRKLRVQVIHTLYINGFVYVCVNKVFISIYIHTCIYSFLYVLNDRVFIFIVMWKGREKK